jgi:hypothetical protein
MELVRDNHWRKCYVMTNLNLFHIVLHGIHQSESVIMTKVSFT